ncbi:MAG: methyltransferase domain-containing protein [Candidatus Thorarchaeota archaeon]
MLKRVIKSLFNKMGYEIRQLPLEKKDVMEESTIKRISEVIRISNPLKVHFGCGPRILKGWINIDLSYEPYHDYMQYYTEKYYPESIRGDQSDLYVFDVTKGSLPFQDNSVDVIFHEDFLEHLNQRGQILFLAETFRILKKGGVHRVNTPNFLFSDVIKSNFANGFEGVHLDEWDKWHHQNILSPESIKEMALMVGYTAVIFNGRDQSVIKELLPLEYRPDPSTPENRNIFADLMK